MTDIKRHEAEKQEIFAAGNAALDEVRAEFEAFKQEVSVAVERWFASGGCDPTKGLVRFILPKPVDPLVEAMQEIWAGTLDFDAAVLREALAVRGYEIRRKNND